MPQTTLSNLAGSKKQEAITYHYTLLLQSIILQWCTPRTGLLKRINYNKEQSKNKIFYSWNRNSTNAQDNNVRFLLLQYYVIT